MGKKKAVKQLADPAPSSFSGRRKEGVKARIRYQSLLEDYDDLAKETELKRKHLMATKQKKLKLISEVKFLQRRLMQLSNNPLGITVYRLKTAAMAAPYLPCSHDVSRLSRMPKNGLAVREKSHDCCGEKAPVIDLNQACLPTGDEMEEFHVDRELSDHEKMRKQAMEGNTTAHPNLLTCRDDGSAVIQVRKRKITWQDQVPVGSAHNIIKRNELFVL